MRKQDLHPRTEALNRSQKNSSDKMRQLALKWLATRFPEAFDNSQRIRPLKTGIMQDILLEVDPALTAGISKSKLREAVVLFTRRVDYLVCLKAKEERIDLQGKSAGVVTEIEADRAALKIKKRVEKSARNARKAITAKSISYFNSKPPAPLNRSTPSAEFSSYLEQRSSLAALSKDANPRSAVGVTIKHKSSRTFDPSAIARLKEKLGLSSMPKEHFSSEEKSTP